MYVDSTEVLDQSDKVVIPDCKDNRCRRDKQDKTIWIQIGVSSSGVRTGSVEHTDVPTPSVNLHMVT
jgi:hypothetical protein